MAKICIDAGHCGKQNRSPGCPEYYESETVWKLSQMQKKYLEALGHEVIMTRADQKKDLALQSRGKKSKGCDLFISDHTNAVGGGGMNEAVSHASIIPQTDDKTTHCDDMSVRFAKAIGPVIAQIMGIQYKVQPRQAQSDRNGDGILNDNYYGVLHGARLVGTPGVILEHGFHTHTATVRWLENDENLEKLAKAEAECINEFFGAPAKTTEPVKTGEPEETAKDRGLPYKVQVTISNLNIRKGPGVSYARKGFIDPGTYTIVEEKDGWGKLKSGAGWIYLAYAKRK